MGLYLYSLACFFIPCLIWQILNKRRIKGQKCGTRHFIWTYIFMFYCYLAVQDAAGIGTIWDLIEYGKIEGSVNLIPFQSEGVMTYILNIIMFMPLGFLLPLIWKEFRRLYKVTITGFCFSFIIELCQLFCLRTTDIDDLIMNAIGTIIGYFVWLLFHKIFRFSGEKAIALSKAEPVIYYVLGVVGIFFLYNWRIFC